MAIMQDAANGRARFYLQFGGQGTFWFNEFNRYYQEPGMKRFFDAVISSIEEELPRIGNTVGLPEGFAIRSWLENPATRPSDEYLETSVVSLTMIQATQLAHFEWLSLNGFPKSELLRYTYGITGHSQGIITACLIGLAKDGDEYYRALSAFMKYILYLGVRCQEAFPYFAATESEIKDSEKLEAGHPGPMAAIIGDDENFVSETVAGFNEQLDKEHQIYISLYNSPTNRILSSHRRSLIEYYKYNKQLFEEKKFRFVFIPTTCPFHSPHMNKVRDLFPSDIKYLNFHYEGKDLAAGVYSFSDMRNMQGDANLEDTMYVEMAIQTLYWEKAVTPAIGSATHVLDFGPGKTTQRFSLDTYEKLMNNMPVFAVAIQRDFKKLTESNQEK